MFSNCVCVSVRFEYIWLIRCIFELCLVAPVGSNFFLFGVEAIQLFYGGGELVRLELWSSGFGWGISNIELPHLPLW